MRKSSKSVHPVLEEAIAELQRLGKSMQGASSNAVGMVAAALEDVAKEVSRLEREEKTLVETVRYTRQELEQKLEEISLVRLVAEAGIRSLLAENPLQFILEHVARLTQAEHGTIMLLDPDQARLYVAASTGPNRIPPYERSYQLGEGIAGWVDRSLSSEEPPLNPDQLELLKESNPEHGSILCYPLLVENTLVGVLSIGHAREGAFTANTERILYIIANQVALAVYNAHLVSLKKRQESHLRQAQEKNRSLAERTNDLIDLARMETGSLRFEKAPVRLREILSSLRPQYKPLLREKDIRMTVHMPKRIPTIEGDAQRLRQLLEILLENSLNATPFGGRISLNVTIEEYDRERWPNIKRPKGGEKFLLFALKDSAPPVPSSIQSSIFEKLAGQSTPAAKEKGNRLSLYFAKEIAEHHKGTIWLESLEDEGNIYYFVIPIPPK